MGKVKTTIHPDYQNDRNLISFLDKLCSGLFENEGKILYNKRNVIKSFDSEAADTTLKNIVVKRYKRPNIIQRIVYSFFRPSKAKRAYHNATELRKKGIDTPHEIAFIEKWGNILFRYGYYVSGYDGASPIRDRLIEPQDFDKQMAIDFAHFAAELHQKGILHHDLNSTNVLYKEEGNRYHFSVIDINRMKFLPEGTAPSKKDCFENLTRFTGRMDLYEFVLRNYIEKRGWNVSENIQEAINVKIRHDEQWRRRKAFFRKISFRKK